MTPNVIERFASGGQISLDGVLLPITAVIQETSELGISFGDEGYLLVVPKSLTKDLSFLERGARYERTLLIQSPSDALTDRLYESIR